MIKVAYCNIKDLNLEKAYSLLPEERKEKLKGFIFDSEKRLSCGSYLLLRKILEEEDINDPIIKTEENGKPYISNHENIFFNMSQSNRMVACAISDKEIGIDIEKKDPLIDLKIADTFFINSEYQTVKKSEDSIDEFFKYWVLKESYMKYTGLGFLLKTDSFEIVDDDGFKVKNQNPDLKEDEEKIKFSLFDLNPYKLAISSEDEVDEIFEYNVEDLY